MFGFIIKKNFCDGWDNLLSVVICNVIFLFSGIGLVMLISLASVSTLLTILAIVFSFVFLSILTFAYSDTAAHIANFDGIRHADYFRAIPGVLKDACLFGLLNSAVTLISSFSIKYYFTQMGQSLLGYMLGFAIVWIDIFYILAMQWFIPIRGLMHNDFKKCFKKCFIILFDNTGFTVAMAFYNLIQLVISVACIGFFPSMTGILIGNTNALRILLYKYDYLEEHPELKTKKERSRIPWEDLIYEDRQLVGKRTIKSFLFPWKEDNEQNM
ncbi:MAG: hypothetical protein J6X84_05815 [Treponema sp.]|nr:hypothetical protein [Treponema sp.]